MNVLPNLNGEPEPNEETLVNVNFDNLEVGKYYFVEHAGYWHLMKVRALDDDAVYIGHIEAFNVGEGWGIPYIYIDEEYADGIPKAKVEDGTFSFYTKEDEEENNEENHENEAPEPEIPPPAPNPEGAANVEMEGNEIHGGARRRTRRMNRKRRSTRRRHSRRRYGRRAATRRHRK